MSELINNVSNNISNTVNNISNNAQNLSNNVLQRANAVSGNVSNNLNNGFNMVSTNVNTGISNVSSGFGNIGDRFMNILPYNSAELVSSGSDFINSNNIIARIIFIVLVIILFIIFFKIGISVISSVMTPNTSPYLFEHMKDAKQLTIVPQDPKSKGSISVYRSKNQYNGLEFTYSTWIFVDDPTYRNNQKYKHIFHKGNDHLGNDSIYYPNNSPGLYLYNGTKDHVEDPNLIDSYDYAHPIMSLLIRQNIFTNEDNNDSDIYEDIDVEGIPINKWVCIIVRVNNQNVMDVFINGKLIKRRKLSGIAKQNYDNVYINMNGGFSGYLSSLKYYNYAIGTFEISSIVSNGPSMKISASANMAHAKPNYLSSKWFFSQSNPLYN